MLLFTCKWCCCVKQLKVYLFYIFHIHPSLERAWIFQMYMKCKCNVRTFWFTFRCCGNWQQDNLGKPQQLLLILFLRLEYRRQLEHHQLWKMRRNWKICRAGCRLCVVSLYWQWADCFIVTDGALEGSVDQIISLPEGSQNTDFRYCSREHLIFTHKLAHTGPKY